MIELFDWLLWHLWHKPRYNWKHRNDSLEQRKAALFEAWKVVLEAYKDEPATKELHGAIDGMDEVRRVLDDRS